MAQSPCGIQPSFPRNVPSRDFHLLRACLPYACQPRSPFPHYAGSEVARYLEVTDSCVTRVASQEVKLEDLQIRYNIS